MQVEKELVQLRAFRHMQSQQLNAWIVMLSPQIIVLNGFQVSNLEGIGCIPNTMADVLHATGPENTTEISSQQEASDLERLAMITPA